MNTWNNTSKNESKVPSARYKRHSVTAETKQAIVCLIQASEHLNKTCVMPELTVSPYGYNIRLQRTNTTGTELNARRLCQAGRLYERDVARIYRNVACSDSCQPFNRADSLRFSRSAAATYPRSTTGKKDEQADDEKGETPPRRGSIVHDNIRLHMVPCRLANTLLFPVAMENYLERCTSPASSFFIPASRSVEPNRHACSQNVGWAWKFQFIFRPISIRSDR